jgi:DNA-binding response OmpR family regulator
MFEFLPADLALRGADGIVTRLTEKERDVLSVLLAARGAAVARDDLLDRVWGFVPGVETHTLETHIYRLRQKLETDPADPVILTTDGDGYRLIVG